MRMSDWSSDVCSADLVTINVLKPGEETVPIRRNANQLEMCIAGTGTVEVSGEDIHLEKWDIANIPSMQVYRHCNTGSDMSVRLTYTNTPLLEKPGDHYVEEDPSIRTRLTQLEERHTQSQAPEPHPGT